MLTARPARWLLLLSVACLLVLLAACAAAPGTSTTTPTATRPAQGTTLLTYRGHSGRVVSLAWSLDGKRIASGEAEPFQNFPEATMRIWDTTTGRTLFTYQSERHYERVWQVAWSPDGARLAAALDDGKVAILDTSTYATVFTYSLQGDAGQVNAVAWSPDGTRLASGGENGLVRVWQAAA